MKKLFLLILTFSLLFACSNEKQDFVVEQEKSNLESIIHSPLYINIDGNYEEVTTKNVKQKWENELALEGIKVSLGNFEVLTSVTDEGEKTYFLKAKSTDGTLETGAFMVSVNNFEEDVSLADGSFILKGKTCSCKGCPNGCALRMFGTNCRCSGCPAGGSQACTKTETQSNDR